MRTEVEANFRLRVLLPTALILALTAAACSGALILAGRGTDDLSVMAQQGEVWKATSASLDELALAQESLGLCETCIQTVASSDPDSGWLNDNIARRLFDLFSVHETYILDSNDRAIFASIEGQQALPETYGNVAPVVGRFVELTRGNTMRSSGASNLTERLPGLAPQPVVIPPQPGFSDEPVLLEPSVRTSPDVVHATDLAMLDDHLAAVSVMRMAGADAGVENIAGRAPVLVNVRYLDERFLDRIAGHHFLPDPRISIDPSPREGETSMPVMNSEGVTLAHFFWKPLLGGAMLVEQMMVPAAMMFAVLAALLFIMALRIRRLMRREDWQLQQLETAHLELKAKETQAHHLAYHDVLTELPNRALFNDTADQVLLRARHGERMAIVLLDLDRFKNINDRFGHLAGDELIKQVGERISGRLKCKNSLARLGGDEFAILLTDEDMDGGIAAKLGLILRDLQQPFDLFGNQGHIGASMGVAIAPLNGVDRTELMRKADIALYRAKEDGRNCYRFFTTPMDELIQLRAALEEDLREALVSYEGLTVHYQPLVGSDGEFTALEALVRWEHSERGPVAPQMFVPVAEETGLIVPLGEWVLKEACEVAREWPNLTVAINLSPVQFCEKDFAGRVCSIVREAGVSPRQIELEVTEGVVLDKNERVKGALRTLREEGFRIALDDFGTGYSSLNYLRDFEIDRIKIDKTFVHGLGHTTDADAIVRAIVTLGHAMGLQVTAEGVETSDQENFLRAAGCNVLQGFHFSHAMPAEKLRDILPSSENTKVA